MSLGRPPSAVTVARVQAIEITLNWRWVPVLVLGTWLLAHDVLPARFPRWEIGTSWVTAAAIVLSGEIALLLHELAHALVARRRGRQVLRIVFHGFQAETVCGDEAVEPAHELAIALAGPTVNLVLAAAFAAATLGLGSQGPLTATLSLLAVGNLAMALMSLLPLGASDGRRALRAWRALGVSARTA